MKKIRIGLAILIVVLLGGLMAAPYLFKDQIKAAIDQQLAASINADVLFDVDNFSLSVFPDFPNITARINELGVVGRGQFAGNVLFAAEEIAIEINLGKLLFDDQLSVQSIRLVKPHILIKVLADGSANYDIALDSGDGAEETAPAGTEDFSIAIENWQITGGHIVYDDATIPTYVELHDLNHTGSGNFSLSVFDLLTQTEVILEKITYDGEEYLAGQKVQMDMVLNMDLDQMKFTFKENTVRLNEFAFGFDGWLAMPADDLDMDVTFAAQDNSFKSLISLIPAMYTDDFKDLKTSGTLSFDGAVKGTYSDTAMPAFSVNLAVDKGMLQYPGLPEAITNVEVKMLVASDDGNLDNTRIDIAKMHLEFGREPFDAYLKIGNLVNYPIDMGLTTTLDLANLNKMFPTEGLEMSGTFLADFKAAGSYDSVKAIIPQLDGRLELKNAEIVYAGLPAPLQGVNFRAEITNTTGKYNDTRLTVPSFAMEVDGSPVTGALLVENFDDYHWEAAMEGKLNFDKLFPIINELYPMPGTTMGGEIFGRFKTEGNMSDVEAERYERLTSSGSLAFNNFTYTDSLYLPQGMKIAAGKFTFTPRQMQVAGLSMTVGASDFNVDGTLGNYLAYIFNDQTIKGNLNLQSQKIDLNEWLVAAEEPAPAAEEEPEPYTVIEVPQNIDFVMQADINQILYEDMVLREARGKIRVRDGVVYLDNLRTSTLGGTITFSGNYDTRNLEKPAFAMQFGVDGVSIREAYAAFNTVQALAPVARHVAGNVSTDFALRGRLQPDMMPDMATLTGGGLLAVKSAEVNNPQLVAGITRYFKGSAKEALVLKDMMMKVRIKDGRLNVEPFDLKLNGYSANIGGSTGLDGSLDYRIKMDIPAGQLGSQVNAAIGALTGSTQDTDVIKINMGLGGTYASPRINLLGTDSKQVAKEAAVNQIVNLAGGDQTLADSLANTDVKQLAEEQRKRAEAALQKQQDSLKKVAEEEAARAKQKALEEANKQLQNLFGTKKKKKNN